MLFDYSKVADAMSNHAEDFVYVILILIAGLIIGKAVGKVIRALIDKTGLLRVIKGTKSKESTRRTSFTLLNFIEAVVRWTIYLIATGQAIEILGFEELTRAMGELVKFLPNVVIALVIVIFGFIAADKIVSALDDFLRESKLPNYTIITSSVRYSIYIIAIIMALAQLHISTQVLVVLAGVFSFFFVVIIAIGAREIATNLFAGLQIIWYRTIAVGDVIRVEGTEGVVDEIGIISTTVKTEDGEYVIIPNSHIANYKVFKKLS
ncbi:MAG TPA: mechanosensitive ion channel [Methanomicrobia archaeon]|nr:mechanosensitive ion channel [Methanomicrobia archaeon]